MLNYLSKHIRVDINNSIYTIIEQYKSFNVLLYIYESFRTKPFPEECFYHFSCSFHSKRIIIERNCDKKWNVNNGDSGVYRTKKKPKTSWKKNCDEKSFCDCNWKPIWKVARDHVHLSYPIQFQDSIYSYRHFY